MLMYDVYKLDRHYFLPIGYEASKKGLKQFANDFNIAVNKLKTNDTFKFDYTKYRSHESASIEMFKKLAHGKFESMDNIDQTEYEWIESCNNSGLNYCAPGKYDCHGFYDSSICNPVYLLDDYHANTGNKRFDIEYVIFFRYYCTVFHSFIIRIFI
jgi:hypothetical protein